MLTLGIQLVDRREGIDSLSACGEGWGGVTPRYPDDASRLSAYLVGNALKHDHIQWSLEVSAENSRSNLRRFNGALRPV